MQTLFLFAACANLAVFVMCVKDDVPSGVFVTALGFAWCLANLLGWI